MHVLSLDNNVVSIETEKKPNYMLRVFLIAFATATMMFLPLILINEGIFVYFGDYIYQQIPFYQICHEAVRTGQFGFNLLTDLGSDFIGAYSYYSLFSPFFWLTLPFPNDWVPYLMGPLFVLKFSVMAVTGYSYINMFVKNPNTAIVGGLLYSFCGFNIYNIVFNVFIDVAVFFPLLLISMEKFVREDKKYFFALVVCFSCLLNYFFFYGQVIFCVIYFFVRINYDDFNVDLKKFSNLALEAVLGLLMACFLLIPSLLILVGNGRIDDFISEISNSIYIIIALLSSLIFPASHPGQLSIVGLAPVSWTSMSLYLPFFGAVGAIGIFTSSKKQFCKPLLVICTVMSIVPFLNSIFSAFNNSYYARWFYMPILIMSLATALALDEDIKLIKYGIKITAIFTVLFIFIGIFPVKTLYKDSFWFYEVDSIYLFIRYSFIVIGSLILLYCLAMIGSHNKYFYKLVIVFTCCVTIISSNILLLYSYSLEFNLFFSIKQDYLNKSIKVDLELPVTLEEQFYRIDTTNENIPNLGMFLKLPSITSFHSVVTPSIVDYYTALDLNRIVVSDVPSSKIGVSGLNNVLYRLISDYKINVEGYSDYSKEIGFSYIDTQDGYLIYQNDYFVPFGVGYDYQVTQSQFDALNDFDAREGDIVEEGIIEESDILLNKVQAESDYVENCKDRILLAGVHLGYDENGNEHNLLPPIETDANYDYLSNEQYFINCETLAENSIQNLELDSYGFTGVYETDRDQILYISLPYTKGFTSKINGEQVDIIKANFGFMAVPVQAGVNYVEFKYETPGLRAGLIISFIALVLFLGYVYLTRRASIKVSTTEEIQSFSTKEIEEIGETPTETSVVEKKDVQENLELDTNSELEGETVLDNREDE